MVVRDYIKVNEATVGKKYEVVIQDCCVVGSFVATLNSVKFDGDGEFSAEAIFDNGVILTTTLAVGLTEVTE